MKKIYLFMVLMAGLAFNPIKAQVDTTALINAYYASDLIFEGVVEDICCYEDPTTGYIYTSNRVNISKIIKGNIQCGTVSIITLGGQLNGYELHVSHQTEFNVGVAGVFMCKSTDYPQPTCNLSSNPIAVELTVAFQGTFEYLFDNINNEVEGLHSYFNTIEEFYQFLSSNGINIIDCNASIISNLRNAAKNKNLPIENIVERLPVTIPIIEQSILAQNTKRIISKLGKSGETIEPFISDVSKVTVGSTDYYDVEVSVKSNSNSIYLGGLLFRLKFNTLALGTNISSVTTFTQGTDFPSSVYDYTSKSDYKDSILRFIIVPSQTNPSRSLLSPTGKIIGTFRVPIVNCKYFANFKIDTTSDYGGFTFFTTGQTDLFGNAFADYKTGSYNTGSTCNPEVTFVTDNLAAGIGDILTINGNYFGTVKGNITMQNADGTPTQVALDKYDIIQWTNTQIQIKVPSSVDSSDFNGTTYTKHPVGTGPITITDAYNLTFTTTPITIKYAVANGTKVYSTGYAKTNRFLFSDNNDGLYHFKLNSNITNDKMINCIKAALRRWRCTTGVPFILDSGTDTVSAKSDGVNIIKLSTLNSNTNAQTNAWSVTGCSTSPSIPFPTTEMDIEINNNKPKFKFDTTGTLNIEADSIDFFRTIMHELGHALGLYHCLNDDMIMYYSSYGAFRLAADRTIFIRNNDLTAANYVVNNSVTTPTGMSCTYHLPITKQTAPCSWNNAINEVNISKTTEIIVYPNPFKSTLTIDFYSGSNITSLLNIFDVTGKRVIENCEVNTKTGWNSYTLTDGHLTNGIYFIHLNIDGHVIKYKVVCSN